LKKGETIIIHGASGGVGTLAVQFARLRGARVFATASGKEGVELVQEMGAHVAVDGKRVDIDDQARRFAADGVDTVLALAGGDALERCLNALRPGGRVAHPNGVEPAPKKRRGMELVRYDGISGVREFERLNAAVQAAKLKVPIAECYPLARAYKAHERLAEGHVVGKSFRCMTRSRVRSQACESWRMLGPAPLPALQRILAILPVNPSSGPP
jgi:NADPH:quinone reductase-like Zn-dependent oxidoreductase